MSPRDYLKLLLEKWKKIEIRIEDFSQKKWWAIPVAANVAVLCLSAVLFGIFLILNWTYIINPESSPGYNCGTPFGDGYDKFIFGIAATQSMIFWLTVFNIVQVVILLRNRDISQKKVLYVFAAIAVIEAVCLGCISLTISFIVCGLLCMIFQNRILMLIIPFTLLILSAILAFKKKRIALPICLFAFAATASVLLELFSCYLYLD